MLTDLPRFYWDSCAWLGLINTELEKHTDLQSVWDAAAQGQCEIWTSAYVYIEVHKAKQQGGDPYPPAESDRRIDEMLDRPHVKRVHLDSDIAKLARGLRRQFPQELTKKGDAIHLASAVWWNADTLHTYDGSHLLPLNKKVNRRDGKPLVISVPDSLAGAPLFDAAKAKEDEGEGEG
jgi:predicted nucleic acid-binding protein